MSVEIRILARIPKADCVPTSDRQYGIVARNFNAVRNGGKINAVNFLKKY